jgi:hypothetical protein
MKGVYPSGGHQDRRLASVSVAKRNNHITTGIKLACSDGPKASPLCILAGDYLSSNKI